MDKYDKVKKIGEGSFGKAVLVKAKKDGHQYVIKEVSISGMSDRERQESRKEVAVLANMSHPNIVQYKESFEEGGCLYIVMDYCEGGDLFKKINSQRGVLFPEEQILDWFVQICLALKHIHDRKILHRDIKSQNIFLTKDGTVQLGDFGIARVLNSTVELARTCIGTPYYLSPEICENKPYNNKSDIWALGCVLYEMCTLKHAFEAGNMKNLVLKIIRGSYHPVSVHYSQELRTLLAQLFQHNPRERPSVGGILDKAFLSCRIQKFLTPKVIAQEFRHAFVRKQPKVGVHQGSAATAATSAGKITKPACKYGVPLTAKKVSGTIKAKDRRTAIKHKAAPASVHRRVSQGEEERRKQELIRKRRMELIDKEKKQQEQMLLKAEQMKRYEREKMSRINYARERGWKNDMMSSIGSPERKCYLGGGKKAGAGASATLSRNPYEKYHAALDQMAQRHSIGGEGSAGPGSPVRGVPAAAGPVLPDGRGPFVNPDAVKKELQRLQDVSKQAHMSRLRTPIAVERAYQVEEFLQRKREAVLNKVRAEGQLGTGQYGALICGAQVGSARLTRPRVNKEEEEYLTRLRQIRLQNFNERQQIKARLRGEKYDSDGSDSQESTEEAELRRKKIVAFKAQANARAAVLKEQLERKRREANEREKKAWDDHFAAQEDFTSMTSQATTVKSSVLPESQAPVIPMTVALKNVGAMTLLKENLPGTDAVMGVQSEKKQILNRLNENFKAQSPADEVLESPAATATEQTSPFQQKVPDVENHHSVEEQKKRDPPQAPVLQPTSEDLCAAASLSPAAGPPSGGDRKKWDEGLPLVLSVAQQTLEETCIPTIEQTVGEVIQMAEGQRKLWQMSPDCQILKVLHEAEVQPLTQSLETLGVEAFPTPDKPKQIDAELAMARPQEDVSSKDRTPPVVEAEVQTERIASYPENVSDMEGHVQGASSTAEIQDQDVELMVLEEVPKASHISVGLLHHAWEKQDQQPLLAKDDLKQGAAAGKEAEGELDGHQRLLMTFYLQYIICSLLMGIHPWSLFTGFSEPLFVKACSPAHRRTSALALLSAQASADQSSSLVSRSRSVSPLHSKQQRALLIGLSTGLFDANNPKMLRTCSLPDLSRVFSSARDSGVAMEDCVAPNANDEDQDQAKDDEQSETDAYEDEDLQDIRASMERLLQEESDLMRKLPHDGRGDFNGNATVRRDQDLFNRIIVQLEQGNDKMAVGEDDDDDVEEEEEDDDDEECSNGSAMDAGELLSNGAGEENHTGKQQLDEWQSDNSEEEPEGQSELYDSIYSRLEEHRFNLEQQMGFEKFIETYNHIKAIRDDEDDNIDLGSSLAFRILGNEHQHLYPNILHLVMADGAYQEGNDKRSEKWSQWQS
ncbi:serine/threonine-protein kinase Nek1 isoform X2 [Syngnathus typhle]|uniref:serine/threonine-protein kinase Nek1 isoform X2 n=1 Tax=Syngnathus typhle TaxID=161592 RepID=UPI002A6B1E4C|nr:serine/threonine-protein kinase Nek1 isoform X2 [Syngnathus typhle]